MRILMVEDAEDLAEGVVAHLARSGVVCDLATSIADARACRAVQRYDAVILDINLPDGSGLSLLREMRRGADRTPVLMLTALASVDDRVAALDQGADDYLGKPFDQRELEARLRALVRREADRKDARIELGSLTYSDLDLTYEAYDMAWDLYITDSGGPLRSPLERPGRARIVAASANGLVSGGRSISGFEICRKLRLFPRARSRASSEFSTS